MEGAYIGPQLKAARKLKGIRTAKVLADKINRSGFGDKVIGQVERDERVAKDYEIQWLADAMDLTPEFFTAPPAVEAETTDQRLDRIEQGLAERDASVRQLLQQQNELLARQSAILEKIEAAIRREEAAASRGARLLDEAARHLEQVLPAEPQGPESEPSTHAIQGNQAD